MLGIHILCFLYILHKIKDRMFNNNNKKTEEKQKVLMNGIMWDNPGKITFIAEKLSANNHNSSPNQIFAHEVNMLNSSRGALLCAVVLCSAIKLSKDLESYLGKLMRPSALLSIRDLPSSHVSFPSPSALTPLWSSALVRTFPTVSRLTKKSAFYPWLKRLFLI